MVDNFNKIKGHFKIISLDSSNNIIDEYSEDNLVMTLARDSVAELLAGINTKNTINKFVIGTQGHITGNILVPKTSNEGFNNSRTELFSEESLDYTYSVGFDVPGISSGACTNVTDSGSGNTVSITQTEKNVEYTITIDNSVGNDTGTIAFTEAALYTDNVIFSMKTFGAKVKDSSVKLKIIWTISF